MIEFTAATLTRKENYKLLSGSIIPRPVAIVNTLGAGTGVLNVAPFSFFTVATSEPPLIMLSVSRHEDCSPKDTARNLTANEEAVLHVCHREIAEAMTKTAAPLPPQESELPLSGFHTAPSALISVPGLAEALLRFETKLYSRQEIKNQAGEIKTDLFLLQVLKYYFDESILDMDHMYILPEKYDPLIRLTGHEFARLGPRFSIEY